MIFREQLERISLLEYPRFIRIVGRWREIDASRIDMQEHQYEVVSQPRLGHNFLRKEIVLNIVLA